MNKEFSIMLFKNFKFDENPRAPPRYAKFSMKIHIWTTKFAIPSMLPLIKMAPPRYPELFLKYELLTNKLEPSKSKQLPKSKEFIVKIVNPKPVLLINVDP